MHQLLGEHAVIREEEETFALFVETSHMEEVPGIRREKFENGSLGVPITTGGRVTGRFIQ